MGKLQGMERCLKRVSEHTTNPELLCCPFVILFLLRLMTTIWTTFSHWTWQQNLSVRSLSTLPTCSTSWWKRNRSARMTWRPSKRTEKRKTTTIWVRTSFCLVQTFVYIKTQAISFYELQMGKDWEFVNLGLNLMLNMILIPCSFSWEEKKI